jgi:hypothetical protein
MSGGGRSIRALSVGVASSAAPLRFRSALSTEPATAAAVAECIGKLLAEPPHAGSASTDASPALPSLLLVWLAGHAPGTVLEQLATHDPELARRALGCTSYSAVHAPAAADRPPVADGAGVSPEGAVGALLGGEVETLGGESALSMVAAWMPGVRVDHWTVDTPRLPDLADLDLGSLVLGSSDARARAAGSSTPPSPPRPSSAPSPTWPTRRKTRPCLPAARFQPTAPPASCCAATWRWTWC